MREMSNRRARMRHTCSLLCDRGFVLSSCISYRVSALSGFCVDIGAIHSGGLKATVPKGERQSDKQIQF